MFTHFPVFPSPTVFLNLNIQILHQLSWNRIIICNFLSAMKFFDIITVRNYAYYSDENSICALKYQRSRIYRNYILCFWKSDLIEQFCRLNNMVLLLLHVSLGHCLNYTLRDYDLPLIITHTHTHTPLLSPHPYKII